MKKVALALLVLAITMPAMAAVNITLTNDANEITIHYACTGNPPEKVRAFALNVSVSNGVYIVGSAEPAQDPVTGDYWVYPTNMTFTVVDGNTVVDEYGSPIAEETVNGGVLEMASLYDENDPCHPSAPASSGDLCSFYIDADCDIAATFTVSLSLNAQRGNIVLENPAVTPTVSLPAALVVPCISEGPKCWVCPSQPFGDATGDGISDASDLLAVKRSWLKTTADPHGTGFGQYNCCADFTQDGIVDASDLLRLKQNWLRVGAACADISCP